MAEARVSRLRHLILATRHDRPPRTPDQAIVMDVDMAILGQATEVFDDYERRIRQEYAWIADAGFARERASFVKALLDRDRIYYTPRFYAKYEARARENLERSLSRLTP